MDIRLLTDLALATLAGYVGTKIIKPVSSKLYALESEQDRSRGPRQPSKLGWL